MAAAVQTTMSFVSVFDMTLGAFDVEVFRRAPYWLLPVSLFMLFMIMVRAVAVSSLCWSRLPLLTWFVTLRSRR